MKYDFKQEFRRAMGRKFGGYAETFMDMATVLQNWVDERINDPQRVVRELDEWAQRNLEEQRKANRARVHAAAEEGEWLIRQQLRHGGGHGWVAYIAKQGYKRRKAYYRMSLAAMRREQPELFDRLAVLGLTACQRIAALPREERQKLHPQMIVPAGVDQKPLEYLTDGQLIDFLKTFSPPAKRPRRKVLRYALRAAERAVLGPAWPEPLTREDAEEARDAAQRLINRLNERLRSA